MQHIRIRSKVTNKPVQVQTKQIITAIFVSCFISYCKADPTAQITFKVVDDTGNCLKDIPVGMGTYTKTAPIRGIYQDIYEGPKGRTDTNGLVTLESSSRTGGFGYGAGGGVLSGYYYDRGGEYSFNVNEVKDGKWQPWNPTIEIIFKPIVNPVPMYAKQRVEIWIPKPNKKYGYDLMIGDWVVPVGKGQIGDIYFEVSGYWEASTNYDSTLSISFARPEDGIQKFEILPPLRGSVFRSPRESPLAGYLPELHLRKSRKPNQKMHEWVNNAVENNNYFFRVRTVLDENGKIKSALYGKVYQGFEFGGAAENSYLIIGDYYLNPESNSRNMEFDPKRNLSKDQKKNVIAP